MPLVISLVIGYCLGLFQTGYIYGKKNGVDVRNHGSGNTGMTNTMRTLGFKAGVITFAGDAGKAIIAMLAVLVWLFLGVSVVLRMFGIDMIGRMTTHARAYWSQPAVNSNSPTQQRNDMLRNMGNNLRR